MGVAALSRGSSSPAPLFFIHRSTSTVVGSLRLAHLFTNGFSHGGGMSYEIACARAKVFRGATIVCPSHRTGRRLSCIPSKNILSPVWLPSPPIPGIIVPSWNRTYATSRRGAPHGVPVVMTTEPAAREPDVAFNVIFPALVVDWRMASALPLKADRDLPL